MLLVILQIVRKSRSLNHFTIYIQSEELCNIRYVVSLKVVWTENNSVISAWAQLSLKMFLALWVFLSFKPLIFYLKVFMRITVTEESRKIWLTSLFGSPFIISSTKVERRNHPHLLGSLFASILIAALGIGWGIKYQSNLI